MAGSVARGLRCGRRDRSTVQVYEAADGRVEIRYRGRVMRWRAIAPASLLAKQTTSPQAWQPAPPPPAVAIGRVGPKRPSVDHPWRRGYEGRAAKRAGAAAAP